MEKWVLRAFIAKNRHVGFEKKYLSQKCKILFFRYFGSKCLHELKHAEQLYV